MPDSTNLILPLILLFIIVIFTIITIILAANRKAMQQYIASLNSNLDSYKNELKDQNAILVKQLIDISKQQDVIQTAKSEDKFEKTLFNTFLKLRGAIRESCVTKMNEIGAARLAIYLLHNGTFSTHGISFFKMSCICEKIAVGSGVRERMIEHTNIPINLFDEMIDKLITIDRYIVMNNDDAHNTNHKIFISADKVKYTQLIAIYDINNNMLGFVVAEMTHDYSKDLADKEKESLDELVKQLVPVLSYSEYATLKHQQ